MTKLNHGYAYGGLKLMKMTVSNFLNIPIHHVVKVNVDGVRNFIDQIGGVKVDVEKDLHYVDHAGDLFIDIKKGEQMLNGDQVVQFLRWVDVAEMG
jgi:LCP family protein required for cell wall assembly